MKPTTIMLLMTLFAGTSCSRVALLDSEWCGDKGKLGARCNWLKSEGKERSVPKAEWDAQRVGMICTDAETFINWKSALKKLCDEQRICFFYQKEVAATEASINRVLSTVK